jgi:hypothetical protein
MERVLLAEGAILVQFNLVRGILLVLHGIVVSLLALVASQGHFYAHLTAPPYYWPPVRLEPGKPTASLPSKAACPARKAKTRMTIKPFFTGN